MWRISERRYKQMKERCEIVTITLPAFEAYLELMGVNDLSKLPTGKGKPPQGDPQVYLGTDEHRLQLLAMNDS